MAFSVRRVVTGDNAQGKAVIVSDETKEAFQRPGNGTAVRQLWMTEETPDPFTGKDITDRIKGTNPPLTGSHFRILEIPPQSGPDPDMKDPAVRARAHENHVAMGVEVGPLGDGKHPGMHRTYSIDYALILDGEIDMMLDDSEVHCKAGDVVIQQGTNHACVNRSNKPCRIAFILIGADVPWKKK
jgi:mannose-6-phosphate isomerase-like protein (cupin superfamily)